MKITEQGWIELDITEDMNKRAQAKADEMGVLRNSIRKGEGNLVGFLGEELVVEAFGGESRNTYQHDIVLDLYGEIKTLEVKTKDRTVPPLPFYEASVTQYNPYQQADFYVFVTLLRKVGTSPRQYIKGWIMGFIPKQDYFKEAVIQKIGDMDTSNDFRFKAPCYNLPYSKLINFSELI